jgi:mono/diheme cytochrome c family protein
MTNHFKFLLCGILLLLVWALLGSSCAERKPFRQGEILYQNFCANCHMDDGTGLKGLIPPLANADYVQADPVRMACIIRYGMAGEVIVNDTTYNQAMPGEPKLSDFEITNIINYINQAWGNDYGYVKFKDVKKALDTCPR